MSELNLPPGDVAILRRLAERKVQLADDPVNVERRQAWLAHDAGPGGRTMILAEHGGVADERKLTHGEELLCEDEWARGIENAMRGEAYVFNTLKGDEVIGRTWDVGWQIGGTGYGVEAEQHRSEQTSGMGAMSWDAALDDLDADFHRLQARTFSVDRDAPRAEKARLEALFDGILDVRFRTWLWWSMGITGVAAQMLGLEGLMLQMVDNPEGVHRLMAFLRDDHLAAIQWHEDEGLLTLNNEADYIGSGSRGHTAALPQPGRGADDPVQASDLWVLLESQETVGVGPEMFAEFVLPYQRSIAERFGRCYYGCCEPVHSRIESIKTLPNVARISVSPWADEEIMAAECGTEIVYSRKPNPSLISTGNFDEQAIRDDLRRTLDVARGCRVELIMKDVHTLNNEPGRLVRWVEIAREVCAEAGLA